MKVNINLPTLYKREMVEAIDNMEKHIEGEIKKIFKEVELDLSIYGKSVIEFKTGRCIEVRAIKVKEFWKDEIKT